MDRAVPLDDLVETFTFRRARSFFDGLAIGKLQYSLAQLDFAVTDYETARAEFERESASLNTAQLVGELEAGTSFLRAGQLLHYRLDSVYGVARRILDRLARVANETLPPGRVTLGTHDKLATQLGKRCEQFGAPPPPELLAQIGDLDHVRTVRDRVEHAWATLDQRVTDTRHEPLTVSLRRVVRVGDDPMIEQFREPAALRDSIENYIRSMLAFIETTPSGTRGRDSR